MRQSLLRKPKVSSDGVGSFILSVYSITLTVGLAIAVTVCYPLLFDKVSDVSSQMVKGIQIPYQTIAYSQNASRFANATNILDAYVPLNGVIMQFEEFSHVSFVISVGIGYVNTTDPTASFVFLDLFPEGYPYPGNGISAVSYYVARVLNPTSNSTAIVQYTIQDNGRDVEFILLIPDNAPETNIYIVDPFTLNYIVYK